MYNRQNLLTDGLLEHNKANKQLFVVPQRGISHHGLLYLQSVWGVYDVSFISREHLTSHALKSLFRHAAGDLAFPLSKALLIRACLVPESLKISHLGDLVLQEPVDSERGNVLKHTGDELTALQSKRIKTS